MKQFFFFLLLEIPVLLCAQPSLDKKHHHPRSEDCLIKQQVKYKEPGPKGKNILWDFSHQEPINAHYKLRYYNFTDSLIIGQEHRTLYKYLLKKDTLFLIGYENQTTLIDNKKPELLLVYPMTYGKRYEEYFHGNGDHCDQLFITSRGKTSIEADAYGMLLLPNGDTLQHVLRTHHIKQVAERIIPYSFREKNDTIYNPDSIEYHLYIDSARIQIDTYRWYAMGYRYPIFETIENTVYINQKPQTIFQTAFYYTPDEQYYGLNNDPENQQIREKIAMQKELKQIYHLPHNNNENDNPSTLINYNISQTNQNNDLTINYYLQENAEIALMLFDMQSKQLTGTKKILQNAGYHQQTFSLYGYQPGEYTLRIVVNELVYGVKIIK